MTEHEAKLRKWDAEEDRGQKWRRLTPLGIVTNIATNFVGTGLIIWLLVFIITDFSKQFDLQNSQNTQVWQAIKEARDQEATDAKCLTKEVFQCCGEKANASC